MDRKDEEQELFVGVGDWLVLWGKMQMEPTTSEIQENKLSPQRRSLFARYFRLPLLVSLFVFVGGSALRAFFLDQIELGSSYMKPALGLGMPAQTFLDIVVQSVVPVIPWSFGVFMVVAAINWGVRFLGDWVGKDSPARADRSAGLLFITIMICTMSFLIYPTVICGCHFSLLGFLISLPAICWGAYPFFFYRTRRERIVGYIAMALSLFWLYVACASNIMYAFRE